jgi:outer membrane protein
MNAGGCRSVPRFKTAVRVGAVCSLSAAALAGVAIAQHPEARSPSQGAQEARREVIALSLEEAIRLSIENNLNTVLAEERSREVNADARQARAGLLPNLGVTASQGRLMTNLLAQGIKLPNTPPVIGPFNSFDARLRLAQTVFDLSKLRTYAAGKAAINVAQYQEKLAREQVASSTALGYVEVLRADRAVGAAQANLKLAESLLRLAADQRKFGIATGVDVARAQTSVAQNQFALAQAKTSAEQGRLQLQRILGLPLGSTVTLTDPLRYVAESRLDAEQAVAHAKAHRFELRALQEQVEQRNLELGAAKAEQYPSVQVGADYGSSGVTPSQNTFATRNITLELAMPIFNGGLAQAHIDAAASRLQQAKLQLHDSGEQVEEDVRLALATLGTTAEQVSAAEASLQLADQLLHLARDRFAAGLADNLEVIDAQTSLATARNNQIAALAAHNAARVNLAAALGRAESLRL